jgi:integrase/recombinase XerD
VLLPDFAADSLRKVPLGPKPNPAYFFWSGNGQRKTYVKDWGRAYRRLFKISGLRQTNGAPKRCFPHMFRDTFAVEQLLAGMSLEDVAELLGNSVQVCEKHYAPFVRARQLKIVENQKRSWTEMGLDPATGKLKAGASS